MMDTSVVSQTLPAVNAMNVARVSLTTIALLGIAFTGCFALKPGLDRAQFAKVELRMTKEQVRAIVGPPDSVSNKEVILYPHEEPYPGEPPRPKPKQETFVYTRRGDFAFVYFEDDSVFGVRFNNEYLKGDWMEGVSIPPPPPRPG
jgi:hypothetical protein